MKLYKERQVSIEAMTFSDLVEMAMSEKSAWIQFMYRNVKFQRMSYTSFHVIGDCGFRGSVGVDDMVVFSRDGLRVMNKGVFDEIYERIVDEK